MLTLKNGLVNEALNLLDRTISEIVNNGMILIQAKRPILLALYQKLAIICFDTENHMLVYPILN